MLVIRNSGAAFVFECVCMWDICRSGDHFFQSMVHSLLIFLKWLLSLHAEDVASNQTAYEHLLRKLQQIQNNKHHILLAVIIRMKSMLMYSI